MARSWEIQPSEFWALSPWEFWLEFEAKKRESEMIQNAGKPGKFTGPEWDEARRKHREKMKANL